VLRSAALSTLAGTAAVVGGAYLYAVYGPRRSRVVVGHVTGMMVGQHIGAIAGWALAGPAGLLTGSMAGGVAGAVIGDDLATGAYARAAAPPEEPR
jgi:hypothetical protein